MQLLLVSIPTYLVRRLQSVLNAVARLIYHLRPHDHITEALATLHWLRVPKRVQYKIAVLTYKVLHDSAPLYLAPLVAVADLPGRRALRSASTSRLIIPPIKLSTVYCWQPYLSGCCSSSFERPARGRHLIVITAVFPASTKDSSFSTILWLLVWHRYADSLKIPPKINEAQKRALCYRVSALTDVKASMPQCGIRSSGAFMPGGLHAGICHAFIHDEVVGTICIYPRRQSRRRG